jgi:hypothetical protein
MESTDPYTNTTTVKNILQHIIVPKIVSDGSSGYVTKTDLTNIHNLIFVGHSTTVGTPSAKNTSQSGSFTTTIQDPIVYHSRITSNSVIIACVQNATGYFPAVQYVVPANGSFTVHLSTVISAPVTVGWFIVHF